MRIAIFTNNYLPNPYGVATSVETFRCELEKLGHQVFIFAPEWPGYVDKDPEVCPPEDISKRKTGCVFRYPAIDIEVKFRFPLPFSRSWKMRRILQKLDLDIIHAQHPNLLGTAAARWARRKKIPLVFTWHTLYDHYVHFARFVPKKMTAGVIVKQAVRFADRADAVVVPTDSIIPILRAWGVKNEKIFPVATGVVPEDFADADGQAIRKEYGIAPDEVVLFSSHRLTQEKNMEFLLRALVPVLKNNKAKFLVAGDGDLAPLLKKFCAENGIADKVIFLGVVARAKIKDYYAAADIFVHASLSETQGMVMTEAMYMGLPVVALSATGANSLVLNNGSGFLVSEKEDEFAEAVLKLVNDQELRQKFGEAAKKIAELKFTSDVCAKELLAVYETAIADKK